jgi:hypothetical protein
MNTMKKIAFLIIILLASCQNLSYAQGNKEASLSMEAFTFNEQCPHVCWLGINPGKTTLKEVKKILSTSSQIEQKSLRVDTYEISGDWHPGNSNAYRCSIVVSLENELVSSVYINFTSFLVGDFVTLLGEPSQISVTLQTAEVNYLDYVMYFPQQKVLVYTSSTGGVNNGPQPTNLIQQLILNTEIYKYTLPESSGEFQPWLGYGHIREYLQGQELPPGFILPE